MFGIGRLGPPELILILLIALLIFGPRKLPEIGRAIGKAFRELRSQARRADSDGSVDDVSPETDASSEEQSTHEQ
jgi:sec-independent protein translocase protein TatA